MTHVVREGLSSWARLQLGLFRLFSFPVVFTEICIDYEFMADWTGQSIWAIDMRPALGVGLLVNYNDRSIDRGFESFSFRTKLTQTIKPNRRSVWDNNDLTFKIAMDIWIKIKKIACMPAFMKNVVAKWAKVAHHKKNCKVKLIITDWQTNQWIV